MLCLLAWCMPCLFFVTVILSVISLLFIAFIHLALICWTKCFVPCISLLHWSTHITSGLLGSLGQLSITCCRFFVVDHAVRGFFFKTSPVGV
jgi:hypothetical protein